MSRELATRVGVAWGALALVLAGCGSAGRDAASTQGTYRGSTEDGREIVLTLHGEGDAVRGEGRIGDTAVTLAGTVQRSASTWLLTEDGRGGPVRIDLHAADAGITLETWEGPVVLSPGAAAPASAGGVFAGRYRGVESGLVQADLEVEQHGALLSGTGEMLGRPAALAGRVLGDRAQASVIFDDGSRLDVTIARAADGSLALRGVGASLELERIGGAP